MGNILTGKVIKIIDEYTLVINKGSNDGVTDADRYLIYRLGEQMIDPDTHEDLGILEIVCGEGKPKHIQERFTTVVTNMQSTKKSKTVVKHGGLSALYGTTEETYDPEVTLIPFENAGTDCLFKKVK